MKIININEKIKTLTRFNSTLNVKLPYKNKRKINNRLHNIYSTNECKKCPKLKKCTSNRIREITEIADPYKQKLKDD